MAHVHPEHHITRICRFAHPVAGQTGSGKTHTLIGVTERAEGSGVLPRAVKVLWQGIAASEQPCTFAVSLSAAEIYCERIRCNRARCYPLLQRNLLGCELLPSASALSYISLTVLVPVIFDVRLSCIR